MTEPTLTFLGAAGTVTGSRFLLDSPHARVLVDAGLYQGVPTLRQRNWAPFQVDPATIDEVVLTHAHLDHTGYLPRLVRDGFRGRVTCTAETAALAAIVLRDSAHLQEEDAAYANELGFSKHRPALPLYGAGDVEDTLPLFEPLPLRTARRIAADTFVTLRPAGHILGSSTATLELDGHRVLFSGDLGRRHHPLLRPPADPPRVDTIVVESTYGDRTHPTPDPSILADAVRRTVERGGSVLIPAFAVDRTELVLLELRRLMEAGDIPRVPVFVDSPMALAALDVYRRALTSGSEQLRPEILGRRDVFDAGDLRVTRTVEESRQLNRPAYPSIVVSASGMAAGGRVVHHLAEQLPDHRNTVVLTGFQAEGTRGRRLLEGAREVKVHGRYVPVNADVVSVPDFSVHSDADETLGWLRRAPAAPRTVYVVHGEPRASSRLADRIRSELGWVAVVPEQGEKLLLD
ncbi:MBL fold metallo-hydrolase RNA specificity domain-containing protein [Nocardioides euryhalodurans]|uniref:MBL fold metallo-hydrolase n=1 Tax=Nocardioides euryhalodurans TaxID=2518370 RepID=A0A4P7GHS3_9ACTN|nr:MBL fold metallo-hydrolase [Nocardioides euryhalodurans]QBR91406.1 MBL fold metallo-hydrolase [Nocardioides euryhalodurans]